VKTKLVEGRVGYSGKELRSGWLAETFGVGCDAIVAFRGSCMVKGADLVDLEDFEAGNIVAGQDMLHFIAEIRGMDLLGVTFAQRLLCALAQEALNSAPAGRVVERSGDDLYVGDGKLSVSVATVSPGSGLIHLGLNVTTEGVPVKAACLADLGVDYRWLAGEVLARFAAEVDSCARAAGKVRPVA
jgi:hypothetical protein